MTAPDSIHRLVERFEENREAYCSGKYNEAQLRHEFNAGTPQAQRADAAGEGNAAAESHDRFHS